MALVRSGLHGPSGALTRLALHALDSFPGCASGFGPSLRLPLRHFASHMRESLRELPSGLGLSLLLEFLDFTCHRGEVFVVGLSLHVFRLIAGPALGGGDQLSGLHHRPFRSFIVAFPSQLACVLPEFVRFAKQRVGGWLIRQGTGDGEQSERRSQGAHEDSLVSS